MTGRIRKYATGAPAAAIRIIRCLNWPARILLVLVTAGLLSVAMIEATSQPGFCRSCHIMGPYYDSWKQSAHAEVKCLECHLRPGFTGLVKGKINGLAQAVDCAVGRVGTKPNATIADASCLRSQCHSPQELAGETLDCSGVRFTHEKHIDKTVDGIWITCGTCHSHFEGDAHFSVNTNACFACHFLDGHSKSGQRVRANCRGCHQVPQQVIRRGFVKIDHSEFVSYRASCEDSCHKREVQQTSRVEETVCLDCHSFRKPADANSVELHASHTNGEKVECFACHGWVAHGRTGVESVSAMMDCQSCHSDTHQAQRSIYGTQHPLTAGAALQPNDADRVLGPMFLTHVECTGCHIERAAKSPGALDSFGTAARATPAACDKCHEAGTGQKYVPFWQEHIKALYAQLERRVKEAETLALTRKDNGQAQEFNQRVRQARSILELIRYDGSWGVHNFKYTEALLLEADKMVSPGGQ
ncbi:MAG: NapC/NirT family cytochrome c [Planctomycetes bacterium]|nr:NapC/NirT family cytochrome c [Planctomycetota bacterium]